MPTYLKQFNIDYDDGKVGYDDASQSVTYDGLSIGKADYLGSDKRSYFDPNKLSGFASKYRDIVGTGIKPLDTMYNQEQQSTNDAIRKFISSNYDTNIYNSDVGKSIMSEYNLKGENASKGAVADTAGSNSGNIDSFSAANALKQQAAFT